MAGIRSRGGADGPASRRALQQLRGQQALRFEVDQFPQELGTRTGRDRRIGLSDEPLESDCSDASSESEWHERVV
jgi:hypothetical protein